MIDIHCHILPDVDDGASHQQAALRMAQHAVKEGITHIIATPHHNNGHYINERTEIIKHVANFNEVLQDYEIPLEISPGQEPHISGELLEDYEKGEILSLNDAGQYVFVELPHNHVPRYTGQLLYDLQLKGLIPIIAHPERNHEFIETPGLLYRLVKDGALTQITASSVTGYFGKTIRKFSFDLIEHNLTHFVASDAHNTTNRKFRMKRACDEIEREFGIDTRYLLQENAQLLLDGKTVAKEIPERIKKKKFLGLF